MALTKVTGQVINDTTGLVVGVTTVGGGLSATDGFFSGIVTFSNSVSVAGTLTYEDVTNIDAVGLVTARNGIVVGSGITLSKDGDGFFTGVTTAPTFSGAFSGSTGTFTGDVDIADKIIHTGDTDTAIRFPAADTITAETGGNERLRIDSGGRLLLKTTTEGHAAADELTIENTAADMGITLRSGTNLQGAIYFSDGTSGADEYRGGVVYHHDGNYMRFYTNGTERIRIDSGGTFHVKTNGMNLENATATNSRGYSITNAAGTTGWTFGNGITASTHQYVIYDDTAGSARFQINGNGAFGLNGGNYGAARQVMVSNGSGSAVSWSSNPFLLDMDSLGDLDYDGVFLRYREVNVSGNGLVYLGLCKSTTNCPEGRIGCPVGFVPGVVYNSQFRVDKVGITPWPDTSGHRYEYFAIISDYVSAGKLGIFYLTNSTN